MDCFGCENTLSDEDKNYKIICDFCKNQYCTTCSKLTKSELYVTRLAKRTMLFSCKDCSPVAVVSKQQQLETSIPTLDKRFQDLKADLERKLMDTVSVLKDSYKSTIADLIKDLGANIIGEIKMSGKQSRSSEPGISSMSRSLETTQTTKKISSKTSHQQVNKVQAISPQPNTDTPGVQQQGTEQQVNLHTLEKGVAQASLKKYINLVTDNLSSTTSSTVLNCNSNEEKSSNSKSIPTSNEADGWTIVERKKTRIPNRPSNSSRPEPLRGTKDNSTGLLRTAPKMAFLFVTGLSADVTSEDILEYLKENNLNHHCKCEKMYTKKEKYRSSFKLAVPVEKRQDYWCSTLWPQGVSINHFLNLQRQGRVSRSSPRQKNMGMQQEDQPLNAQGNTIQKIK